jgi:hypothetical protein
MRQWIQSKKKDLINSIESEVRGKFKKEKAIRLEKEKKEKCKTPLEESKHESEKDKEGLIDTKAPVDEEEFTIQESDEI